MAVAGRNKKSIPFLCVQLGQAAVLVGQQEIQEKPEGQDPSACPGEQDWHRGAAGCWWWGSPERDSRRDTVTELCFLLSWPASSPGAAGEAETPLCPVKAAVLFRGVV